MIDSGRLGVFVGVLNYRGILGLILSIGLVLGASACSDPDERMPWPTVKMPQEVTKLWKSSCIPLLLNNSRIFEAQVEKDGKFEAVENQFLGTDCKGVVDNRRKRYGQVDTIQQVDENTWKISAHMYKPKFPGDLISTEIVLQMANGQAHIRPIAANLLDLNDKIQKIWDDKDPISWVLEPIE